MDAHNMFAVVLGISIVAVGGVVAFLCQKYLFAKYKRVPKAGDDDPQW